ncbi:MAG TPA: hypothetical protein VLX92_35170 [Kofleriaceae bacterium]|nr:hypothetical protein [Kofleriaceae bacterium]
MAKSPFSKRDEERQLTRRALIKWSVAAGAALGVSRAKILDILEKTAGKDVAFAAGAAPTTRSVHLVAGNGGLAWFMGGFWPHYDVAAANNPNFATKTGMTTPVQGTHNPLTLSVDAPWQSLPPQNQVTAFVCGANQTHTRTPTSVTSLNGANIFSVAGALQASSPSVIPLITIGDADAGTATGAPTPANVSDASGIVGLFNSAASRSGGLLSNTSDAQLYKAHYDAFTQLNRAANRSTTKLSYTTASGAAQFLGTNLSAQLSTTAADLQRYQITGNTPSNVAAIGNAFIVAVKAFKMGLTNCICMPAMDDDPHTAWDQGTINTVPGQLKAIFDAFMTDLQMTTDDVTMQALADDTVLTIHGDTHKDPFTRGGWPDNTPGGSNVVYVYSAGYLYSGWFGSVDRNQKLTGFDSNGKPATFNGTSETNYALASIAYAIAKSDDRATSTFTSGQSVSGIFGPPKDLG